MTIFSEIVVSSFGHPHVPLGMQVVRGRKVQPTNDTPIYQGSNYDTIIKHVPSSSIPSKTRHRAITTFILRVVLGIFSIWLFLLFLLFYFPSLQTMMVFQHTIRPGPQVGDPSNYIGMHRCSRRVETSTSDGVRLVGWHIMPRNHDACKSYILSLIQEKKRYEEERKQKLLLMDREDAVLIDKAPHAKDAHRNSAKLRNELFSKALTDASSSSSILPEEENHSKVTT